MIIVFGDLSMDVIRTVWEVVRKFARFMWRSIAAAPVPIQQQCGRTTFPVKLLAAKLPFPGTFLL
jgi:hypothetical protein